LARRNCDESAPFKSSGGTNDGLRRCSTKSLCERFLGRPAIERHAIELVGDDVCEALLGRGSVRIDHTPYCSSFNPPTSLLRGGIRALRTRINRPIVKI